MTNAQPRICPGDAQRSLGYGDIRRSPNLDQTTRPRESQPKKRICRVADFAILPDKRITLNESEKRDKYQELARELKKRKLWIMKVTVIPIVNDELETISERFLKGMEDLQIRGQMETIQTSALRSAKILR